MNVLSQHRPKPRDRRWLLPGLLMLAGMLVTRPSAAQLGPVPPAPFGTTPGTVADGGALAAAEANLTTVTSTLQASAAMASAAQATANAAIPSMTLGQPQGPAQLDGNGAASALPILAAGSVTPRTAGARAADSLNLLDHMQSSDKDATAGFTRAITHALAIGSPAKLYLPCGTYTLSGTITITTAAKTNQGVAIEGESSACVVVRQTADADVFDVALNSWGSNAFQGGAIKITGITFNMAAPASTTRSAIKITTAGATGAAGTPLILDDLTFQSPSAAQYWGTEIAISDFGFVYLSRINGYYVGQNSAGTHISIQGTSQSYTTSVYLSDATLVNGHTGVQWGNYLQGMHWRNVNTVGTLYSMDATPDAGLDEEYQGISSYLDGHFRISATPETFTGSINGTTLTVGTALDQNLAANNVVRWGPSQAVTGAVSGSTLTLAAAPATPFVAGDQVTWSGGSATIGAVTSSTVYTILGPPQTVASGTAMTGTISATIASVQSPTSYTLTASAGTVASTAMSAQVSAIGSVQLTDTYFDALNGVAAGDTHVYLNQIGDLRLDEDHFQGKAGEDGIIGLSINGTNVVPGHVIASSFTGYGSPNGTAKGVAIQQNAIKFPIEFLGNSMMANSIDCQDNNTVDDPWEGTNLSNNQHMSNMECGPTGPGNGVNMTGGRAGGKAQAWVTAGSDPAIQTVWIAKGLPGIDFNFLDGVGNTLLALHDSQSGTAGGSDGIGAFGAPAGKTPYLGPNHPADDILLGMPGPLAPSTGGGLPQIPFTNGTPTGTPATTGGATMLWNDSTKTLNIYSPGAASWYHVTLTAGAG